MNKRRLIEDWLPIAALSEESVRERRSMTSLPPTYYLHVWFARRPLVASRAAILGSLLDAGANREKFLYELGIHGDPVAAKIRMAEANAKGIRLDAEPYGYSRAFQFVPTPLESRATVLDPTAGGGSIPFEAVRLGVDATANDLNPVASLLLKATVELPLRYGTALLERYRSLAAEFVKRATPRFAGVFPKEDQSVITVDGYLWARTVNCPYCGGIVPLSPNWKLSSSGSGVRLVPENGRIRFEIVDREPDHSPGTVKNGEGVCPFPSCHRAIDGDEIKRQAQAGQMGHQLYCVVYKQNRIKGYSKNGKAQTERVRSYRAVRPGDDVEARVRQQLEEKMPFWRASNIVPDEEIDSLSNYDRGHRLYGITRWTQMFSSRQLYGHCVSVEVFQDMLREIVNTDLDRAAITYLGLSLDKLLNYNAIAVRWIPQREVIASVFDRHNFAFYWSYAEIAPAITGLGYEWVIEQTDKALRELIELLGQSTDGKFQFAAPRPKPTVSVTCASADALPLEAASIDCIVMDPPYYDNVMYAELADFFFTCG